MTYRSLSATDAASPSLSLSVASGAMGGAMSHTQTCGTMVVSLAAAAGVVAVVDLVRTFFHIKTPDPVSAEELGLPSLFVTLKNVRDVAVGKNGLNDRRLKIGLLFRSAKLHGLPVSDKVLLRVMGVKFVADFRSQQEVHREPDSFQEGHNVLHQMFEAVDGDPRVLVEKFIREGGGPPGFASEQMKEINRSFVKVHAKHFRSFLQALAQEGALPALVHCTAGKDRTGWAVALLLSTLGVSEDDIVKDYLRSNALYYKEARKYMLLIRLFSRFRISAEEIAPLLVVKPEFILEAFATAKASHGTMDNYIVAPDGLGLSSEDVQKLRKLFLEEE